MPPGAIVANEAWRLSKSSVYEIYPCRNYDTSELRYKLQIIDVGRRALFDANICPCPKQSTILPD